LDTVETEIVMGAMEEKEYQTGQNVIREGDGGDVLYMVE
jgi:hypothetical protein